MNYNLFATKPTEYSRNYIISELLKDMNIKNVTILPCFKKKYFLRNWFKRDFLVNDFFISDFDSKIQDRQRYSKYSFMALKYYILDQINFKLSKYILSDTQSHLDYWEIFLGKTKAKTFVLPVLADIKMFYPQQTVKINKGTLQVLFYGTFIPLQGIDKIIYAIKELEQYTHIKFTLIGNGQETNNIIKLMEDLKITDRIEYKNTSISRDELRDEIYKADITLGIFGDSKKASCVIANKVYESLACKKCIITMDSPGIREFFDDKSIYLVENDAHSIAEAILKLDNNRELIQSYAKAGYSRFMELYNQTKIKFQHFIAEIDS